jgi:hypothetical protein
MLSVGFAGLLGALAWPIILAAVDADFGVRRRLRASETLAFAVVDLRTIKPERKAAIFGNCLPMFDGDVEHEANVVGGVYATVEMFWPLPPGVVTCRLSCEAPKERWNGMFDLGPTVLSARFLDNLAIPIGTVIEL